MKKMLLLFCGLCVLLTGCIFAPREKNWGSFTADLTYSYDGAYYATQKVEDIEDVAYVTVEIYSAVNDEFVFSFSPARAWDFWGICWESDSYNIWIQSADIGIFCYAYDGQVWQLDEDAQRPADIISKYDR